jgi:P4 family phage/plasmid primase-like protien
MTTRTVSQILLEDHSISIRPGAKGECPSCHLKYFSLKGDDSIGKCFHPPCGYFLTIGQDNGQYRHSVPRVLTAVYQDFHQELLYFASGQQNAYTYLRDERGIHPQVIADAMLGAVPSGYNVTPHFQPVLDEAKDALAKLQGKKRGRPTQQLEQVEKRLQDLQEAQQKLIDCLAHKAGWLVFFYTDAGHRPVALRLRQSYSRKFVSFKLGIAGVFGRELFTPYVNPAHQALNDFLLVVEGEFNALQLQSLTIRYEEATGQTLGYVNTCAVGGVSVADAGTIERITPHPVIVYDNDTNQAGFELVKRLQKVMPVEACTTPLHWGTKSDLDSYIRDFQQNHVDAWEGVKALIAERQLYGRTYAGTGEEFFDYPIEGKRKVFTPRLLGEALLARETYRYTASQLWVYRNGVYLPYGEATLHADAQQLLGNERRVDRINEALSYVAVATRLEDEIPPDCQYINLRNGRLDWALGELQPHTPAVFTTVQLPVEYDPAATCPAFDEYLNTTFDADVIPFIEEILGWCLVPNRRFEHAVMLTGDGENGKSVFLDLVGYLLGEGNVSNIALQDLEENRFRAAELYGKLANVFADLDARGLQSSSMFKTLTTGDYVTAERKHVQPFRFRSYAKLLFSANKIPSSRDRTHAFYRRWLIIPFTRTFDGVGGNPTPDKELRTKLQAELPGIFNRALQGLQRLTLSEKFTLPKIVLEAKQAYIRSNDNVRVFLEECVIVDTNETIVKKEFYRVYENWCDQYGERAVSQKALREVLMQSIPRLDEVRAAPTDPWSWLGMKWSEDAKDYMSPSFQVKRSGQGDTHVPF